MLRNVLDFITAAFGNGRVKDPAFEAALIRARATRAMLAGEWV